MLRISFRAGEARLIYEVTPLPDATHVPILHEYYAGSATRVDDHDIRVDWSPVSARSFRDSLVFDCLGLFRADETDCYLLRVGERLIVERAIFIQPFIWLQDYVRMHGSLPDDVGRIVAEPALDRDALAEFLSRLAPDVESSNQPSPAPGGDERDAASR